MGDPALTVEEAMLDTLAEWADRIPYSQRVQLSEAITRICILQRDADVARDRAVAARTLQRPGWPVQRAIFAAADARN